MGSALCSLSFDAQVTDRTLGAGRIGQLLPLDNFFWSAVAVIEYGSDILPSGGVLISGDDRWETWAPWVNTA